MSPPAMRGSRAAVIILLVSSLLAIASAQGSASWRTLSGNAPLVVARGGFSGMFPDSSSFAYQLALITSVPNVVVWCDVQLTKDGVGICAPELRLENSTSIADLFPRKRNTYVVNGDSLKGWFSIDFTLNDLLPVYLTQGIGSRSGRFNLNQLPILTVVDVVKQVKPPGLWLNIQLDQFFTQHNLNMRTFVISTWKSVPVSYISSPEVNFLKSIVARVNGTKTKLIFRFMAENTFEPSTNQTYASLKKNLTFIKAFASGILVPKNYIWPVTSDNYLQPYDSIVLDAHKIGLEVYAADFVNDKSLSYNYSYDPIAESLQYIDNGQFSIDGFITDFPITQSEAIDCFAQLGKTAGQDAPLVISYNGASGDFPSCTDLAYTKAINDGANVIDCPVQMSKDKVPFCFSSIDLMDSSMIAPFFNRSVPIPELMPGNRIFSFSLTWDEVKNLTSQISNPYQEYSLYRNPKNKNAGNFVSLSGFLELAKNASNLSGVLIRIENAAYLAEKQGMSVTEAVLDALDKAGYSNDTKMKVMIQSTNSSVLNWMKGKGNYERVYEVDEKIRDAENSTVEDIKNFANSVVVKKMSVLPTNSLYLTLSTNTVAKLKAFNLPVYVQTFSNEFVSQAWDFFSDATVEINSFVMGLEVDGVITDFPKTAAAYKKNKCLGLNDSTPPYMSTVQPGALLQLIPSLALPPAQAPLPVLTESDVVEPPLPSALTTSPPPASGTTTPSAPAPGSNGQPKLSAPVFVSGLPVLLIASLFLLL